MNGLAIFPSHTRLLLLYFLEVPGFLAYPSVIRFLGRGKLLPVVRRLAFAWLSSILFEGRVIIGRPFSFHRDVIWKLMENVLV